MKWTILASVLLCAAVFITGLSFLAISCFNLTSTENLFPIPAVTKWRGYLLHMIGLAIFVMIMATLSCWGATRRRNSCVATLVIVGHICVLGVSVVYCNLMYNEVAHCKSDPAIIKNKTLLEFKRYHKLHKNADSKWLPEWLDSVQKHSPTCCGVAGYQDWNEFWPEHPHQVPRSCCRTESRCVSDFYMIDWPEKPSDYIKNDEGCAATMSKHASKRIEETLKFLTALIILLACTVVGFTLQYLLDYWGVSGGEKRDEEGDDPFCFSWAKVKFRRKGPNRQDASDPNGNDPNNGDIGPEAGQVAEAGSYSYTYIQQLKELDQSKPSEGETNASSSAQQQQPLPQTSFNPNSTNIFNMSQASRNTRASAQPYTYEVLPNSSNTMYMQKPLNVGSSQSLPDEGPGSAQQDPDSAQPIPMIFNDDTEKQNLKQLLRFGRRHRRHRKNDIDADRQQQ